MKIFRQRCLPRFNSPFKFCFLLLVSQALIFLGYVLNLFTPKLDSDGDVIRLSNTSERDLYFNDELKLKNSNDDAECAKNFLESYSKYCETALVPSQTTIQQHYGTSSIGDSLCPCLPLNIDGTANLNLSSATLPAEIINGILPGGHWKPSWCIPRQRIAIIIPFRNREAHLDVFLKVFHPFLQNQLHSYSIFVIEQRDPWIFNKAAMMNIGFVEIVKRTDRTFDCFIFHDVDIFPQDNRNIYGCYRMPKHVAAYLDKYNYRLKYHKVFGGATAFTRRQFELSNGFSNEFWGWGGEDDDMYNRIVAANFTFFRYPKCVAKYSMIKHEVDKGNTRNKRAAKGWAYRPKVYKRDGLNSVNYSLIGYEEKPLYTKFIASLPFHNVATAQTTNSSTHALQPQNATHTTNRLLPAP